MSIVLKIVGTIAIIGAAIIAPEIVVPVGVALGALYAVK